MAERLGPHKIQGVGIINPMKTAQIMPAELVDTKPSEEFNILSLLEPCK
jgi:hypothetical protein